MMKQLWAWLDERTGAGRVVDALLFQNLPGGSRWRYSWGAVVLYTFLLQAVTGFFLWTAYSPSTQTAWESIHYDQNEMTGGWLLRACTTSGRRRSWSCWCCICSRWSSTGSIARHAR